MNVFFCWILSKSTSMDSSFNGAVFDPEKCSKLSMEEKREIVYELSKWSQGAPEMLQSWSRQDILQILCAEMGKERKYTGMTKLKMIEHLLKIISGKKSGEHEAKVLEQKPPPSPAISNRNLKRPQKTAHPSKLPVFAPSNPSLSNVVTDPGTAICCKNYACKASLSKEDAFCKRCSCCICHKFDDNKDPSLWLTCNSDPPYQGNSCNMSCHLECALKHGRSGIMKNRKDQKLDGCYRCISCGKMNDLLRCWRRQLIIAKDTRRVDILCYRLALSQKLVTGTKIYQNLSNIVDEAVGKLEMEVGPLTGIPVKMGRGIVNRLSSGQEIQRLCASAVESLDMMLSDTKLYQSSDPAIEDAKQVAPNMIRFEEVCATSVSVILGPEIPSSANNMGYTLWHHKASDDENKNAGPTCTLFPPERRYFVSGLLPATEYVFKVVSFDNGKDLSTYEVRLKTSGNENEIVNGEKLERSQSPATNCSSLSNPSSVEDETCNVVLYNSLTEKKAANCCDYFISNGKMVCGDLSNCTAAREGQNPMCTSAEEHATGKKSCTDQCLALKKENEHPSDAPHGEATSSDTGLNNPSRKGLESTQFEGPEPNLPVTPCRRESMEGGGRIGKPRSSRKELYNGSGKVQEEPRARSSSKKRNGESQDGDCSANDPSNVDFSYYVKVVCWLEREGHIDKSFRQKFLTWYSMRATAQEHRIVKIFVDTLHEDPAALAEQLLDTFGELISSKRTCSVPAGFCMKIWH